MAKCGKICYSSKSAAIAAMRQVPATTIRVPLRAYRCGKCRAWHFTSKARR